MDCDRRESPEGADQSALYSGSRNDRGIATPVCGLVRNDNVSFKAFCYTKMPSARIARRAFFYFTSSLKLSPSVRMRMAEMGCSKLSMMAWLMGSSSSRWMVRRRFRAP